MSDRVGAFEKVSFAQFFKDWQENMGGTPAEIRAVYEGILLPRRATAGSAGYDFFAPGDITFTPGESVMVPTGIRVKMEEGWALLMFPRSSLGFKYRLQLNNTIGIIDADYYNAANEGHIMCRLMSDSRQNVPFTVKAAQGLVQGIFMPFGITVDDAANGKRSGGFGSTTK